MSDFIRRARNGKLPELIELMRNTANKINMAIDALESTILFDSPVIENRVEHALEMCQELETQISEEMGHDDITEFLDMLADDIDGIEVQEAGDTMTLSRDDGLIMADSIVI